MTRTRHMPQAEAREISIFVMAITFSAQ